MASAYAIAHLRTPNLHPEVVEYMERIQATLDPFDGRFVVHSPNVDVMEGTWPGTIVVVGFPDVARAHAWYASPTYQEILPLRANHIEGETIIVDGVDADYDLAKKARALRTT